MMPVTQEELDLAAIAFRDFCEGDLPESHPFQHAWDRWQSHHGEIESEMPLCSFIEAAILYGIQHEQIRAANAKHDAKFDEAKALLDRMHSGTNWVIRQPDCPENWVELFMAVRVGSLGKVGYCAGKTTEGDWTTYKTGVFTPEFFESCPWQQLPIDLSKSDAAAISFAVMEGDRPS